MSDWNEVYVGEFDATKSDKDQILKKVWVPCRICRQIFNRIRLTARFCASCDHAFCEGEHGSFVGRGPATCVRCYKAAGDIA